MMSYRQGMESDIKKSPAGIWQEYQEAIAFNQSLDLYDTVEVNNNFYNDKQWEGVQAPNLDKPIINIIKPAVNYYISQLVSDDIGINLQCNGLDSQTAETINKLVSKELNDILEFSNAGFKHRQLLRNMAVDGDMVLYSYFDNTVETGKPYKGSIQTEIIYNTDIYFGNPIEWDIQKQPYVIIKQRRLLASVRQEAEANGLDGNGIKADDENSPYQRDTVKDYVTVLVKFWRQRGQVHYLKTTQAALIRKETNLEYSRYPIAYASWEPVKNSYHGVSPISGKINNQIAINKIYAMAAVHIQSMAFPKVLYDKTKLPQGWSNDPAKAIAVNGDPNEAIFSTFKSADMSGQVQGLIQQMIQDTKDSMGIYDAALGNVKPDNTSAIVATQKAAAAPLDLQRLDFYNFVEDNIRNWLDIMAVDYGIRDCQVGAAVGMNMDGEVPLPLQFDFGQLRSLNYKLAIDIGASSYWSELMQVQTLDNLMNLHILPDSITYLESIPDGYIKNKEQIIAKIRQKEQEMAQLQALQQMPLTDNSLPPIV